MRLNPNGLGLIAFLAAMILRYCIQFQWTVHIHFPLGHFLCPSFGHMRQLERLEAQLDTAPHLVRLAYIPRHINTHS